MSLNELFDELRKKTTNNNQIKLREYQQQLIDDIKQSINQGYKKICCVLPCGGGKSVIQGAFAKELTHNKKQVLFLVHRKELLEQIKETFIKIGVDMDFCDFYMVQTATRENHFKKITYPDFIFTDECHHATSNTYVKIYDFFSNSIKLGFTATPVRLDGKGLNHIYDKLITSVNAEWLIENNCLSKSTLFSVELADTSNLKTEKGDYRKKDLAELMEKKVIYGEAFKTWKAKALDKKTIIYCSTIQSSKSLIDKFKSNGVLAEHLDGTTPKKHRKYVIERFRQGKIKVLSNVDLFGEGFDVPDCECVMLLRPTKSLSLYIQQSMRSMRYVKGKKALIIDHVANVYKHGFPDIEREWDLNDKKVNKKTMKATEKNYKECPNCQAVFTTDIRVCEECCFEFFELPELPTVDVELKILKKDDVFFKKYSNYKQCKTFGELCDFQKANGYKFQWVRYKCEELGIEVPLKYQKKSQYGYGYGNHY